MVLLDHGRSPGGLPTAPQSAPGGRLDRAARRLGLLLLGPSLRAHRAHRAHRTHRTHVVRPCAPETDVVRLWLRRILPADSCQRAVMTFDSWHSPRMTLEVATDELGNLLTVNRRVVAEAMRIIDSGDTLIVQVCSTDAGVQVPYQSAAITRVWVFDREGARAIDAETLQENLTPQERADREGWGARFATGWALTGEPGGAAGPRGAPAS